MKQTIKSILAIAMILCMLFTVVGCGEKEKVNSDQQVAAGDDFFTDEATQTEKDTPSDSTTPNDNTASNNGGTTTVPQQNTIGGKSWKDVLASMPKKLRGSSLVMYNWNTASEYTGAPEVIEKFTKETGIKVTWQNVTFDNYFTKLTALVASGKNIPDVVRLRADEYTLLQNLQPLSKTGYDFSDQAWDQGLMGLYTYGNNTYATSLQNTHIGCVNMLFYNSSLIKKYDLEDPYQLWKAGKWNWDKYIEMCRAFKEVAGDGAVASNGEGHFKVYGSCYGLQGAIAYNGKSFYNAMKDANFLEVHQKLGDLYNKEKLFEFGGQTKFNDGTSLFSIGSAIHLRRKNSYFGNLKSANTLMAVPLPEITGQGTYYQGLGEAEAYGIAKGASNPEAVPYFLRYFLDGSNYQLSNYFGNEQNLEVYNWCMNQKNKVMSYGYPSGMGAADTEGSIEAQTGAQMKSYIDANYGVTDKAVKEYNDILASLK